MLKIADLVPSNLQEEKIKFFASGYTYNPQFTYPQPIDERQLTQYGKPKRWLLLQARWIVWKYEHQQKNQPQKSVKNSRQQLTQAQLTTLLLERLRHYQLDQVYQIKFSDKFVSRISVNLKQKEIKVQLPVQIGADEIEAVMAHEIDTHILRQYNSEQQVWHGKKKKYGLSNHLRTEEGLAIINEMVASGELLAYRTALNYLAVDLAQRGNFSQVFNFFLVHGQNPERAWTWTVKKKRGLSDTSHKGGFTKDVVYFEGFVEVLQFLKKNKFDPQLLYYGKVATEDAQKAKAINPEYKPLLPLFIKNSLETFSTVTKKLCNQNLII